MDKIQSGEIRKITIGDVKTGFFFSVGQKLSAGNKEIEITRILRDENNYFFFGAMRYIIYAQHESEEFIWNYFENQPVRVECFV